MIQTSHKTGFSYENGRLTLYRKCRVGKEKRAKWRVSAIRESDTRVRFRSKRALRNYDLVMPQCDPVDFDLMDEAFERHVRETQAFRRQRKERDLQFRNAAHCHKAEWLRDMQDFSGSECLFFPSAMAGLPERVRYNYRQMPAARAMLLMTQRTAPDGKPFAVHKCGMGHMSCVNPAHLAWGTAKSNADDREIHNRDISVPDGFTREDAERVRETKGLSKVIAWDLRIPAALVSAIKSESMWG